MKNFKREVIMEKGIGQTVKIITTMILFGIVEKEAVLFNLHALHDLLKIC